ncbi:cytochrome P450 4C1-like [Copidosoma floridanum]|uniref:cytochrome P450 4C1-like n=1 Tax=Copidosoma floridanum TaxID=29053 RepID=UPI0006C95540|nr:cytochrome P450 4C1-like [Copidosoma floridanum]
MVLIFLLTLALTLFILEIYLRYRRIGRYIRKIPGPTGYPIIGNVLLYLIPHDKLWNLLRSTGNEYYPIYKITSLNIAVANLRHPDDAEVLLSSSIHIDKSIIYDLLQPWFGTGLLTSTGPKWHHRRKILTPAFHFNVLKKYGEIMMENSEKLIKSLKEDESCIYDLVPLITKYTLDVMCEAAMGIQVHGREEKMNQYRNAIHKMSNVILHRLLRPWLRFNWLFGLTSMATQQMEILETLHSFTTQIINERKEYHKKTNGEFLKKLVSDELIDNQSNDKVLGVSKRRLAMLDHLIAAYKEGQIDDDGICEEVDTFTFEGHDTSAMSMCFLLLLLAEHKDVQSKARAEINEVLEVTDGKLRMEDLPKLSYLEQCVKESLRLYPGVPFISRSVTRDLQLKNYLIPKGAIAHLHVFDLHRDPNFWPEPDKFDPDRFLPDLIQHRHPFSFLPFSAGPRNCIGQKFAMMELKTLTAHLLHNFYLEPIDLAHDVPIHCDLVIRPSRPMHIKFIPIH